MSTATTEKPSRTKREAAAERARVFALLSEYQAKLTACQDAILTAQAATATSTEHARGAFALKRASALIYACERLLRFASPLHQHTAMPDIEHIELELRLNDFDTTLDGVRELRDAARQRK